MMWLISEGGVRQERIHDINKTVFDIPLQKGPSAVGPCCAPRSEMVKYTT